MFSLRWVRLAHHSDAAPVYSVLVDARYIWVVRWVCVRCMFIVLRHTVDEFSGSVRSFSGAASAAPAAKKPEKGGRNETR